MAKIQLRRVAGFNRDPLLSLVKFLDFKGRNSPFGRTRVNLNCDHTRASVLVSHVPMPYPNTIKQKKSTGLPSFDVGQRGRQRSLNFSIGVRVSAKRESEASQSHQNQGGDTS